MALEALARLLLSWWWWWWYSDGACLDQVCSFYECKRIVISSFLVLGWSRPFRHYFCSAFSLRRMSPQLIQKDFVRAICRKKLVHGSCSLGKLVWSIIGLRYHVARFSKPFHYLPNIRKYLGISHSFWSSIPAICVSPWRAIIDALDNIHFLSFASMRNNSNLLTKFSFRPPIRSIAFTSDWAFYRTCVPTI